MQSPALCSRWQLEQTGRSPLHFIFLLRHGLHARAILRRLCFARAGVLAFAGSSTPASEDCVGILVMDFLANGRRGATLDGHEAVRRGV